LRASQGVSGGAIMAISRQSGPAYDQGRASAGCGPCAKEHTMAKGQKRSNKETKKPKAEKKAPAPDVTPGSVTGVLDRRRK